MIKTKDELPKPLTIRFQLVEAELTASRSLPSGGDFECPCGDTEAVG